MAMVEAETRASVQLSLCLEQADVSHLRTLASRWVTSHRIAWRRVASTATGRTKEHNDNNGIRERLKQYWEDRSICKNYLIHLLLPLLTSIISFILHVKYEYTLYHMLIANIIQLHVT